MKLTHDQIQRLYKFTRAHYVEHYDLQTELVDHLANGIEQLQEETLSLTFQEALNYEFNKFGVFGFHEVIKKRKKSMGKRYWSHILKFYREYFQLPRILLVFSLSGLLFFILQLIMPEYRFITITLLYFVIGIYFLFKANNNKKLYRSRLGIKKRWMLEEKIFDLGEWAQMAIFPMYFFNTLVSFEYSIVNPFLEAGICVFTVCYLILCYVMVFVIPTKAEKLLEETYPEYKLL